MRVRRYRVVARGRRGRRVAGAGQGLSRRPQRCERALPHRGVQPAGGEVDGQQAGDLVAAAEGDGQPGEALLVLVDHLGVTGLRDPVELGQKRPPRPDRRSGVRDQAQLRHRSLPGRPVERRQSHPDEARRRVGQASGPATSRRAPSGVPPPRRPPARPRRPRAPRASPSRPARPRAPRDEGPARSASGGSMPRASAAMPGPTVQPPPSRRAAPTSASVASTRVTVARGSPVARATPATEAPGCSERHSSTWKARRIDSLRPAPAKERNSSVKGADSNPRRAARRWRPDREGSPDPGEALALRRRDDRPGARGAPPAQSRNRGASSARAHRCRSRSPPDPGPRVRRAGLRGRQGSGGEVPADRAAAPAGGRAQRARRADRRRRVRLLERVRRTVPDADRGAPGGRRG